MTDTTMKLKTVCRPARGLFLLLSAALLTSSLQALPVINDSGVRSGGGVLGSPRGPSRQQRELSIDEAIAIAERQYNGRAVGARAVGPGIYRVRILQDDGKVKTVTISR